MLSPDQVKPFLTHANEDVRALAGDYFSESWSQDPEILPLVLDARDQYGDEPYFRNLSRAKHLVITESTLDRLLAELEKAESDHVAENLGGLIAKAPIGLLDRHRELLEGHPKLSASLIESFELRRKYSSWTGEKLWDELRRLTRHADHHPEAHYDTAMANAIVDALASCDVPDPETICRLLEKSERVGGWLEIYVAQLAGRRRIVEAVPILVENLRDEDDGNAFTEMVAEAISRIGDVSAIDPIVRGFPEADWHFKFSSAFLIGHLKHPESEAAALELLKSGTEEEIFRTGLCMSLCELISEHALEAVRQEIASGSQEAFREVSPAALAVAEMLGQELPKGAGQWVRERDRQREAIRKAEEEWMSPRESAEFSEDPVFEEEPEPEVEAEVTAPIRNVGPRTGRNDPCPCRSGKKYKKCCGASR